MVNENSSNTNQWTTQTNKRNHSSSSNTSKMLSPNIKQNKTKILASPNRYKELV